MSGRAPDAQQLIARLLRQTLKHGSTVEIEGLGIFLPATEKGKSFRFVPQSKPRIFIAYVEEDLNHARTLYSQFSAAGFDPWLDKKKLLPGQNWPRAIENAINSADFFVACFSRKSVSKRGSFQCELRYALECANRQPLDEIFFIPLRIEECTLPARITRRVQYVDLFPNWEEGLDHVVQTIRQETENRIGKDPGGRHKRGLG